MISRSGQNGMVARYFAYYFIFALVVASAGALIYRAEPVNACAGVVPFDPNVSFETPPGDLYEDEEIQIIVNVRQMTSGGAAGNSLGGTQVGFQMKFDEFWRTGQMRVGDGVFTGYDPAAILPKENKRAIECTGVPPNAAPIIGVNSISFSDMNITGSAFNNPDYMYTGGSSSSVLDNAISYVENNFGFSQGFLIHLLPSHGNSGSGGAADRFYHKGCPVGTLTAAQTSNTAINVVDIAGTTVEVFDAKYDETKPAFWQAGASSASFDMDPEAKPQNNGSPQENAQAWRIQQGFNGPERPDDPPFLGQPFPAPVQDPATSKFTIRYSYITPGKYTVAAYAAVQMNIKGTWTWKERKNGTESGPYSMTITMNVLKTGTGINAGNGGQQTDLLDLEILDKTPPSAVYWTNGSDKLEASTGGYITKTSSGSTDLTFDVIDNNPLFEEWIKAAATEAAADTTGTKKSPISIFYVVQGYDYIKKSNESFEKGIQPVPVEKYFWAEVEVPPGLIKDGTVIESATPFDMDGQPAPFNNSNPQAISSSNPAGCMISFRIPLVMTDGSPLFKEPTGWYYGLNSVDYTDDFGEIRRGWEDTRLKFFVAVNDGSGNVNPPYWMGVAQSHASCKRVITPWKDLKSGTDWDAAGPWEDFLAGSTVGSGIGVQPGSFNALTDYGDLTSANAIVNMNRNWDRWDAEWQTRDVLVPASSPTLPTKMNSDGRSIPDFAFPPGCANPDWYKDNFSQYGYIEVDDDDPPSARINIKDVGTGKTYTWGNALWGDYHRHASQKVVHENLDTVYTKTNQDLVNRYSFSGGSLSLMAGSPFDLDNIFNVNGGAVLEFGGGAIPEYQNQQNWISSDFFQPWSWNAPGHPMNGVKNSYFIPEDTRIALAGFSVDNINTWNKNYNQSGKTYSFGCLSAGGSSGSGVAENKLYDATGPEPDKGAVSFYTFRTPNTETGAEAYYYIKAFDSASPTLSDELKLNFKVMDRKVSVHTIDRR